MNIFVTDWDPHKSAKVLPDKHVVKMPLETCQMLSIVFSHWYYDWGDDLIKKKDGTPYSVTKGAFRNHRKTFVFLSFSSCRKHTSNPFICAMKSHCFLEKTTKSNEITFKNVMF